MSRAPIEFPAVGLTDGVIRLRLHADADVPPLVRACQDPAIQRYTTVPGPYGPGDARSFIAGARDAIGDGTALNLAIVSADGGELLGNVAIRRHHADPGRWSVGYLVFPEARGRGAATRAVRLVCRYGFDELGAERVEITAEPSNTASLRVAEAAGFTREGLLRSHQLVKGVRRDMIMFSLLPGELR